MRKEGNVGAAHCLVARQLRGVKDTRAGTFTLAFLAFIPVSLPDIVYIQPFIHPFIHSFINSFVSHFVTSLRLLMERQTDVNRTKRSDS